MFDVGFWELVILFGLGLIVLGPERMPKVAAQLGRWVGQARNMARHLTSQIKDEIEPFESGMKSVNEAMNTDFAARRPEPGQTAADNSDSETEDDQFEDNHADDAAAPEGDKANNS